MQPTMKAGGLKIKEEGSKKIAQHNDGSYQGVKRKRATRRFEEGGEIGHSCSFGTQKVRRWDVPL